MAFATRLAAQHNDVSCSRSRSAGQLNQFNAGQAIGGNFRRQCPAVVPAVLYAYIYTRERRNPENVPGTTKTETRGGRVPAASLITRMIIPRHKAGRMRRPFPRAGNSRARGRRQPFVCRRVNNTLPSRPH